MADISKITLPSGNSYDIKDAVARAAIEALNSWEYVLCTNAANTPKDVTWTQGTTEITGTLVAAKATMYKIYLVPQGVTETHDIFEEYITINTSTTSTPSYSWEKMGDTDIDLSILGDFAYVDKGTVTIKPKGQNASSSVTFTGGTTDKVLGEATTFTNSNSSVTFAQHTTATVLKSDVTATVPKPSGTTKYLTASASGTALNPTTGGALTSLGTPDTETFVKSYPGATSKLVTGSVTGVKSNTTTASKATAGTAKNVATTGTAVSAVTSFEAPSSGAGSLLSTATVSNEVLTLGSVNPSTTSITPAVANGSITPYTFQDVTVPIKADSATTVATGSLASNGSGGSVMTGLGTAVTATGVTGYSDVSSDNFVKTVSVSSQPTITLTSASSTSTGAVSYISAVGTSGTNSVTFATSGHTADAITALGSATAAAQTITVGTNDKVTAITNIGTGTAAAQTFTGTEETYDVNPKTT